jgi:hypothetical protein
MQLAFSRPVFLNRWAAALGAYIGPLVGHWVLLVGRQAYFAKDDNIRQEFHKNDFFNQPY